MKRILNNSGMGLLSILFALAIIGLIYFFAVKNQKNSGSAQNSYLKQTTVDASSYKSTIDSTKQMLDKAVADKNKQAEGF